MVCVFKLGTSTNLIQINDSSTARSSRASVSHGHLDPYTQSELIIGKAVIPTTSAWSNRDLLNPVETDGTREMVVSPNQGTSPAHKLSESEAHQVEIHH